MRLLKETIELRADTETEAKNLIEEYRQNAREKGYTIGAAGYVYKTKKAKGEIIDEAWVVTIKQIYSDIWEEFE